LTAGERANILLFNISKGEKMAELKPKNIAIIGCGGISEIYMENLGKKFKITNLIGCSDILPEAAKKSAEKYNIKVMTNDEIFNDPEIEIVVNLTDPQSHYKISKAALNAGKHVYSEKMSAVELDEGVELLELSRSKNLYFGLAPDTFLGAGPQTARWIIDSGMIGTPILVYGICQRKYILEQNDSKISFVHKAGGSIPFDMSGYYIHCFVNLFGPVEKVTGFTQTRNQKRFFLNPHSPLYGDEYVLDSINTMNASLQFANGVLGNLAVTSESVNDGMEKIEIVGTEGSLFIHDPNYFSGPIMVKRPGNPEPLVIPYTHAFTDNFRGLGVADMAYAIKNNRMARTDASLGLHAFEIIHKVWESAAMGQTYSLKHSVERPAIMPKSALGDQCAEGVLDYAGF